MTDVPFAAVSGDASARPLRPSRLHELGHALMRLCNPKQQALGTIVYRLICFGASFPS